MKIFQVISLYFIFLYSYATVAALVISAFEYIFPDSMSDSVVRVCFFLTGYFFKIFLDKIVVPFMDDHFR